jgi:hypothetical protein
MARTVTVDEVDRASENVEYITRGTLTIAVVTMPNGFQVVGTSACADPAKYAHDVGCRFALEKAKDQVWTLLGYVLRQELHDEENA